MYAMGAQSIDCRRKVRIHGLRCAIHVLRKSILCTQYIHVDEPCQAVYIVLKHYLLIEKINTIHSLPISMLLGPPSPTFLSLLFITIHPVKSSHLLLFLPGFLIPLLGKFISEGTCTAKQLSLKILSFGHSIALSETLLYMIYGKPNRLICAPCLFPPVLFGLM